MSQTLARLSHLLKSFSLQRIAKSHFPPHYTPLLSSITPCPPLSGLANPSICFSVKQAKQLPAVKIVDENWLRAAILGVQAANGSQSSASQPSSAAPPSAPASAATKGKKRAHDEVQSYRDPSADVDALEDEEEEQPPLKKPKDGQKAKSTSLVCGFSLP